jgi:hypothetical protein
MVYKRVRALCSCWASGVDTLLVRLEPLLESTGEARSGTPHREAVLAALNGVRGDRLAASHNPLATVMSRILSQ